MTNTNNIDNDKSDNVYRTTTTINDKKENATNNKSGFFQSLKNTAMYKPYKKIFNMGIFGLLLVILSTNTNMSIIMENVLKEQCNNIINNNNNTIF